MGRLKLYIDENVDVRIVEGLRKRGMDTFYAVEESSIGIPDEEQFKHAEKLQAVIFTHDHHFIEIADTLNRKGKDPVDWQRAERGCNRYWIKPCHRK